MRELFLEVLELGGGALFTELDQPLGAPIIQQNVELCLDDIAGFPAQIFGENSVELRLERGFTEPEFRDDIANGGLEDRAEVLAVGFAVFWEDVRLDIGGQIQLDLALVLSDVVGGFFVDLASDGLLDAAWEKDFIVEMLRDVSSLAVDRVVESAGDESSDGIRLLDGASECSSSQEADSEDGEEAHD